MTPIKSFKRSIASLASRAVNFFGKSGTGFFSSAFTFLSGSNRNWNQEAGPRYDNSAVFAAIQYLTRQITGDPRFIVQRQTTGKNGKTEWSETQHKLPTILKRGSVMSEDQLIAGAIISMVAAGNGYWVKDRGMRGEVIGFVYVPHWQMSAVRDRPSPFGDRLNDGTHLVTFYEFRNPDGTRIPLRVDDVIHFRWGMDPARPESGLAPIFAALREIVTDNDAATLGAALLANAGIPGVAISPKADTQGPDLTPEQRTDLNTKFARRISGDMAGTPFIAPFPCDFTVIGFSPDKLTLGATRSLAVTRIFGPLGIDPMVCGFPSEQKTYSNFEEALRAAWRSGCKPVLRLLSEAIDSQCLQTDFLSDPDQMRAYWDLSEVNEEQDDKFKVAELLLEEWKGDAITREMYLQARGYDSDTTRDDVFYSHSKPVQEKVVTDPKAIKKALMSRAALSAGKLEAAEAVMED